MNKLKKDDKDRIRNRFIHGKPAVEVQYLRLKFEAFNHKLFNALMNLKAADNSKRPANQLTKRKASDYLQTADKRRKMS